KLAALPDESKDPGPRLAEAYDLRLQAYQQFRAVHELVEGAKFEPGEAFRKRLEGVSTTAQRLLLYLLATIHHRPYLRPEAVPEPLRLAAARFRATLADELQILAGRMLGKDGRPDHDLSGALVELEHSVSSHIGAVTDPNLTSQIQGRLELYRESVP